MNFLRKFVDKCIKVTYEEQPKVESVEERYKVLLALTRAQLNEIRLEADND